MVERLKNELLLPDFQLNKKCQAFLTQSAGVILGKPNTYMNNSGQAVRAVVDYFSIKTDDVFVIHDDLDLELGNYKLHFAKGPKEHNGLLSIYQHLGTQNFWHIRIGVDGRGGDRTIRPSDYVLQRFLSSEQVRLEAVINEVVRLLSVKIAS